MELKITRDRSFKEKVPYNVIHGKFPYKAYLEIKGNCKYGRYIVVVSDSKLENIESIAIKVNGAIGTNIDIVKKDYVHFKVKEIDIFTVDKTPLFVFKPLKGK